jgi:hypothetical protein
MGFLLTLEIETPTGHVVLVDDDLELSGSLSMSSNGYAQICPPGMGKSVPLHQYIMGTAGGGRRTIVDHINRNKLDNRRENLRLVNPTDSNLNRKDYEKKSKLPKWVYPNRKGYAAQVSRYRKRYNLGTYATPEEAHTVALKFVEEYDS